MAGQLNHTNPVLQLQLLGANEFFQRLVIFGFVIMVGMLTAIILPEGGGDIRDAFLPSLSNWRTPWLEGNLLFPWSSLVLMPLRLFSPQTGTILVNVLSVFLTALVIRRLGGNILLTLPVFISPVGYWLITTGQMDALILAGFILLPAGLDLLFFWKPQLLLHALWIRIFQHPRVYLLSITLLLIASFLIWGNWIQAILPSSAGALVDAWWNRSLYPYSIPVGILFLVLSIRRKDDSYGILASPLLSPYVNGPSYIGLLTVLAVKWPRLFFFLYSVFWIYYIIRFYMRYY